MFTLFVVLQFLAAIILIWNYYEFRRLGTVIDHPRITRFITRSTKALAIYIAFQIVGVLLEFWWFRFGMLMTILVHYVFCIYVAVLTRRRRLKMELMKPNIIFPENEPEHVAETKFQISQIIDNLEKEKQKVAHDDDKP